MQKQLAQFDARIAAMEASLGVTPPQEVPPQGNSGAAISSGALRLRTGFTPKRTPMLTLHRGLATTTNSVMDAKGFHRK